MLTNKFASLEIKKSRVHEFMRDDCNLSFKQTTCWPEARANVDNIQKCYDWVVKWSNTDMYFSKNCVFIDEAGFDINLKPSRAWAPRGQMARTTTPTTKTYSHTILGATVASKTVRTKRIFFFLHLLRHTTSTECYL
jgi:hypothetical protein